LVIDAFIILVDQGESDETPGSRESKHRFLFPVFPRLTPVSSLGTSHLSTKDPDPTPDPRTTPATQDTHSLF